MARLYTNENFPLQGAEELRRLGHDVLTIQESGKALQATPDDEVLAFARAEERTVVTLNRKHFLRLHQAAPDHSGIVVCTYDPDFARQAHRIHAALQEHLSLNGKLLRVNRPAS
jgi:predicted nuclease of predicted toxin-antitoxin system